MHLAAYPLCKLCEAKGLLVGASIVDHIEPHKGSYDLFWSASNWQSLCKPCHDSFKQAFENVERGQCDVDGYGGNDW